MGDVFNWNELSAADRKLILDFVNDNNHAVREMMRNSFPDLYIGRESIEVARGWLMIAGLEEIKKYMGGSSDA